MPQATNIVFTELIKINNRLREFNFRKRGDTLYDVDAADEIGNRYVFRAIKKDRWRIDGKSLPQWITAAEPDIAGVLEKM